MSKTNITPTHKTVKTQKAKGILALRANGISGLSTQALQSIVVHPYQPHPDFPFFARPCPLVPRHGFVDSRMIFDDAGWDALLTEIAASGEKKAEIICMPQVNARWSGILTPASLTIGPGHAGATSGQGARTIPALAASRERFLDVFHIKTAAAVSGVKDTPFIEMVADETRIEAVQLRDGPNVGNGHSYVATAVTVTQVVEAKGDLLQWEALMQQSAKDQGVVVWHPGGCLSSHYAVQAIVHQLPVVCTQDPPAIGAVLEASKDGPAPLSDRDYRLLSRVVGTAVRTEIPDATEHSDMIHLAIGALHGQAMWGPERHLLILRAVGVAYMLRFSVAAILGELRHWNSSGPGRSGVAMTTKLGQFAKGKHKLNRASVYGRAFKKNIMHLTDKLPTAQADFLTIGWSGSFGGKKWAKCANVVSRLYGAVGAFLKQPTSDNWMQVVSLWNQAVNVFHNTGAMLNKFINGGVMDALAVCPSYGLVSHLVARLALEAEQYVEHKIPTKVGKRLGVMPEALPDQPNKTGKNDPLLPAIGEKTAAMKTAKAIKAMKWPTTFKGTYKDAPGDDQISIQIATPVPLNKSYGAGCVVTVEQKIKRNLMATAVSTTSLTGSETPAWACEFIVEKKGDGMMSMKLWLNKGGVEIELPGNEPVVQAILAAVTLTEGGAHVEL